MNLNSDSLIYFFLTRSAVLTHPHSKTIRFFLEVHFYSVVETTILKSGWLVRNVVVWIILSNACQAVALRVMKEDAQLSYNNLQGNDGQ